MQPVNRNAPPSLSAYLRAERRDLWATGAVLVAYVLLSLSAPLAMGRAVDALPRGDAAWPEFLRWAAIFAALSAAAVGVSYGMRAIPLKLGLKVEYALRRDLFAHLERLEPAFYREQRIGDLMTRMSSDIATVREFVGQGLLQGGRAALVTVFALAFMFATHTGLAWLMLAVFPPLVWVFARLLRAIRVRYEHLQEQSSEVSNYAQETFAGIRTVKGFALEPRRADRFRDLARELARRNLRLAWIQQPMWPLFSLWFAFGHALLLVAGGRLIARGELTYGQLLQFLQYLAFLQWPLLSIGWTASLVQRGRASWGRIRRLLERASAIVDAPGAAPGGDGPLEFRDVTVRGGGRTLLDCVSFTVPRGSTLGLTGPTGSGKTLLVSLVPRLLDPDEGAVRFGGRDLRAWPLAALRARLGMAPQEPVLFSDTLAANLGFGMETPAEDDILRAADIAHLHEDAVRFPQRYDTLLGERGVTLSGGQRQRAALGRALARRPVLLILDDVLSAVDTHTEAAILAKLRPVMAQATTLLVSHRVSTLRDCDRILVLENGRITQDGTHADLLARPGYYRDLDERQRIEDHLEDAP